MKFAGISNDRLVELLNDVTKEVSTRLAQKDKAKRGFTEIKNEILLVQYGLFLGTEKEIVCTEPTKFSKQYIRCYFQEDKDLCDYSVIDLREFDVWLEKQ